MTRARRPRHAETSDKTDIAGTVSPQDRATCRRAAFALAPCVRFRVRRTGSPGWVWGGFAIARGRAAAPEKGVRFMLSRHMDELHPREHRSRPGSRSAPHTPCAKPARAGQLLAERQRRGARAGSTSGPEGCHRATGGMQGSAAAHHIDPDVRAVDRVRSSALIDRLHGRQRDHRRHEGRRPPAGMLQNQHSSGSPTISSVLGTRDTVGSTFPGTPAFLFARAKGFNIGAAGWEHAVAVNQVGQRFYNERAINNVASDAKYPPGTDGTRKEFVPLDWRNASPTQVNAQNKRSSAVDAALAMNEGSRGPDYASGPVWAIFDSAAVARWRWQIRYPYIADPPDGYFHKADTLAELAKKVMGHPSADAPEAPGGVTVARYPPWGEGRARTSKRCCTRSGAAALRGSGARPGERLRRPAHQRGAGAGPQGRHSASIPAAKPATGCQHASTRTRRYRRDDARRAVDLTLQKRPAIDPVAGLSVMEGRLAQSTVQAFALVASLGLACDAASRRPSKFDWSGRWFAPIRQSALRYDRRSGRRRHHRNTRSG